MPQPKDKTKVQDWKDKISKTLQGRRCCMRTEFAKGHIPFNKGTKGICKPNKTSFKKGNIPHTYRGGIRVDKDDGVYVLVGRYNYPDGRTSCKYESKARIVYREKFGDFPKGMIIFHKDGDVFNNDIENLELISRAENLRRNQYKNKNICCICGLEFLGRVKKCKTCSVECRKEYNKLLGKEYQQTHKDKFLEGNKRYREKNKEKIRESNRKYREKQRLLIPTNISLHNIKV